MITLLLPAISYALTNEYTLDNGLKVIIIEQHKAPVVTFQIWYKVGARNESTYPTGISHMLEHMMFKGTKRYGANVLSTTVSRNGGVDNAFTTKDYTVYYETLPADRINISLQFESDRMRGLLLDEKELVSEKQVVIEERRMRTEDNPQNSLNEEVNAAAFKAHPYHNPVIGWMSDIESYKRDDLYEYYQAFYSPNNAFIIVVGDVNSKALISDIKKNFGDIQNIPRKYKTPAKEPAQNGERRVILKKKAELPYMLMAYHVPSMPNEDSYALDVMTGVLEGKSGRLYKDIIKKGIAVNAFTSYDSLSPDPDLLALGGSVGQGQDIKKLETALNAEVKRLQTELTAKEDIQKVINQIEASFIKEQDSSFSLGMTTGGFEILGDYKLKDVYIENIKKVTPEDVKRVAVKYLTVENKTVGVLEPIK
ncbi:MAG: insulinase family protein [Nitrospirae bacterium]|nr:insulinase family protein [Nitrospirota bacterium]